MVNATFDVFVLLFHQNSILLFATSGVLCERAQASKCCVVFARCPIRLPLVGMGWELIGTGSRVASPNCALPQIYEDIKVVGCGWGT